MAVILPQNLNTFNVYGIYLYLTIFLWIYLFFKKHNISFKELTIGNTRKVPWLKIGITTTLMYVLSTAITVAGILYLMYLFPSFITDAGSGGPVVEETLLRVLIHILLTVLTAPIVEELLFRGILQNKLSFKYGRVIGIVLTALLFAVIHPLSMLSAFIISIFLSILYIRYQTIIVPILAHVFFNFLSIIQTYGLAPSSEEPAITVPNVEALWIISGIILFLCMLIIPLVYVFFVRETAR
ncbi:CPBP family intramembrane metalloprotease [Paenalkalicoccus suaedae]|uniref:CPBP family intramembrane metalloprotease n=1 Tax=Paenalkalicoccus suaedae TaxID=2592382 RepID=A0A859FA18_9BACI|nr:type II CAAX endopeptidase family protein [Paenalkalicoccus suaedae]QKS69710.1 CPBP family intramembrane metalloprotease [Paenalkalicoccus suaedae]